MAIEFYSVKHRRKVQVDESQVQKKTYERETSKGTQTRYAFQAETTVDGDKGFVVGAYLSHHLRAESIERISLFLKLRNVLTPKTVGDMGDALKALLEVSFEPLTLAVPPVGCIKTPLQATR